jgi:hypothetical protein
LGRNRISLTFSCFFCSKASLHGYPPRVVVVLVSRERCSRPAR